MRRGGDPFARIPIDAITRNAGESGLWWLAIEPVGKKCTHDMVANGELGHIACDRCHHACAVGHGNTPLRARDHAFDDSIVVIIERTCLEIDSDLACRGSGCVIDVYQFECVEGGGRRACADSFHSAASANSAR